MFEVKDKEGTVIHIEDLVLGEDETLYIVMNMYEDGSVKLCPCEADGSVTKGLPLIVSSSLVKVEESFITQLESLSSCKELQEILMQAETRFNNKPLSRKKGKTSVKTEEIFELDI